MTTNDKEKTEAKNEIPKQQQIFKISNIRVPIILI